MKKHILLLIVVWSINFCRAQNETEHIKRINQFLTQEYSKNEPGAVVLVAQKGKILLKKAYGLASLKPKRKLKTDMVFQVASISKQFVSAAILQLIEQGKMSLTDTIQKYVPYYPSKKYPITIHHLLSQTSGIPEYFILEDNEYYLLAKEHTPKQLIAYYKNESLLFKPGEKWSYSNSNYPLLGAALEKVTGLSLREYMRIHIFEPLSMTSSGLWYNNNIKSKRIPVGYNNKRDSLFPGPKIASSAMYAAGGVVSTLDDLFLWNRALKNKTKISESIVKQLISEKTTITGKRTGYGYGFFLNTLQGSPTIEHGGNLFGYTATELYLPDEDVFVCILANTKYDRTGELANYIASVLIEKPIEIFSEKDISTQLLKEYVGIYKMTGKTPRAFEIKIYQDAILLSDPKYPESSAILTASKKDIFLLKVASASFQFFRNKEGKISGYTVQQGADNFTFKKVK